MRWAVGERVVPLRHVAIGRAGGGRTAAEVLVEEIAANGGGTHCEKRLGSCVVMRRPEMRCLAGCFLLSRRRVSSPRGVAGAESGSIVFREWTDSSVMPVQDRTVIRNGCQ